MKKILLSAAAIFAAMSMNAQEFCSFNPDNALNLDAENGSALTAGTVIGETTSIVAKIGADDTFKPQSATFIANGEPISGGLQGNTNPKDADGGTPATTLIQPASGAFLVFEAKADGFLYVMHKASSNKAYTVFEEGTAISYTFAAIGDASSLLGGVYSFTLPYEVENEQFVVKNPVDGRNVLQFTELFPRCAESHQRQPFTIVSHLGKPHGTCLTRCLHRRNVLAGQRPLL